VIGMYTYTCASLPITTKIVSCEQCHVKKFVNCVFYRGPSVSFPNKAVLHI